MTEKKPFEFATEILLPFTLELIKTADSPWDKARLFDPQKYTFSKKVDSFLEKETSNLD